MRNSIKENLNFGSSLDNPDGLQLKLNFDEDTQTSFSDFVCPAKFQGEPNQIHPGIITVLLDEAMKKVNESMNFKISPCELLVRILHPALVEQPLHLRGWFIKKNRKVIESRAELEDKLGKIVARAKGKYIELD